MATHKQCKLIKSLTGSSEYLQNSGKKNSGILVVSLVSEEGDEIND